MKLAKLWKKAPDLGVKCNLCERRCQIPEGHLGFCRSRQNQGGKLYSTVYGKLCSAGMDPIEKKPLFHFLPGTNSFSISTTGCNYRCKFCFTPDTFVVTSEGAHKISELFDDGSSPVLTKSGKFFAVKKHFRHKYKGDVIKVKPAFLPEFSCTPNHRVFATTAPTKEALEKVEVQNLTKKHFLAVPKPSLGTKMRVINTKELLMRYNAPSFRVRKKVTPAKLQEMTALKQKGYSSKEIGEAVGLHPAYVRTVFSRANRFGAERVTRSAFKCSLVEEKGRVRFKNEKGMGIPLEVKLTPKLGRLLGLYCAEGCVVTHLSRPNSLTLRFSFGKHEQDLVNETKSLLEEVFGANPLLSVTPTTHSVVTNNSSLAALFKMLCGRRSSEKKVPALIFKSPPKVVTAFLRGYLDGDGCYKKDYVDAVSVSKTLTMGVFELLLRVGVLPGFYEYHPPAIGKICGRTVKMKPEYIVRFSALFDLEKRRWVGKKKKYHFKEDDNHFFVPVRKLSKEKYDGYVYNLEVDTDHSYTANFAAVCNCQNWQISQATVDEAPFQETKPAEVVKAAKASDCKSIAYTYTEPTIFYEFAKDVSKLADKEKIKNIFVTNGYMTPEMLKDYNGLLHAANVDIKGDDRFYREMCGGVEMDHVLDNIKRLHRMGVWVEVTNLIIPGYNDDKDSIHQIARFIADLDKEIPMHFSAFFPQYLMTDTPQTPRETLVKARSIAMDVGVHYAYCGNTFPGDPFENTYCPECDSLLIKRHGYSIVSRDSDGRCDNCGHKLAGVFK